MAELLKSTKNCQNGQNFAKSSHIDYPTIGYFCVLLFTSLPRARKPPFTSFWTEPKVIIIQTNFCALESCPRHDYS